MQNVSGHCKLFFPSLALFFLYVYTLLLFVCMKFACVGSYIGNVEVISGVCNKQLKHEKYNKRCTWTTMNVHDSLWKWRFNLIWTIPSNLNDTKSNLKARQIQLNMESNDLDVRSKQFIWIAKGAFLRQSLACHKCHTPYQNSTYQLVC